ncbi:3-methyl-2-oxobutanoate hydroxymethyltransferase [Candidatus Photodesmus blepharus]|uniref:3-methyl-2-oxobutanoate hydroxymethyltransferase n=1 Tax=Candidatus Photodesmus blepharonis TaxID=1179155 RepID=A0A084CN57_9GAMM|nr:3-methyl-2-oxobutanoate hydroxymethyltransferase [Candidatus Photodesmus blepharus]KEY91236.1 3-methyl-2-oxobutanoate hydroxymethyltransferase [Candidatus Photodesmus blepharus]
MKKITINDLIKWKQKGLKFATSTAYDASFAQIFESQDIPVLLVGDSLGMVLQGKKNTLSVTVEDIAYHTQCVRTGSPNCLLMADMPFMSYATLEQTYKNAAILMKAGANMIKIEGDSWLVSTVQTLTERAVPVCVHIGLTPQFINILGGYKVQGRDQEGADCIVKDALALQEAGAQMVLLECVPKELAARVTDILDIPVIGIGAGNVTDGQILVMHDMFGISSSHIPKFAKNFLEENGDICSAVAKYIEEVQNGTFPSDLHTIA